MAEKSLPLVKNRIDTTVYSVSLDEKDFLRILAQQVMREIGPHSIDADFVNVRAYLSRHDSSTGPYEVAKIEITIDHSKQGQTTVGKYRD